MEEWKEYKLGEICTKIGSGATPKGGKEAYLGGDTSLIRSQNVLDFSFSWDGLAYIDDEQATKLNGVEIAKGDVLLNITGDSVARACIVPESALPARVNQHVSIIRGDTSLVLNDYIMYFLQYKKPYLLSLSQGGATRNALTKGMIEDLAIPLPPLSKQKEIVRVLKNLDDKIEVNRRINDNFVIEIFIQILLIWMQTTPINDNLEQQAQYLFKSWFVDFEPFKDREMVESEIGMIPKDWKIGHYEDITEMTISGDWGKEKPEGNYVHKVACIRGCDFQDIKNGLRGNTPERYILEKNYQSKHFRHNDVLVEISGGTQTVSTGRVCPVSQMLIDKFNEDIVCTNFCRVVRPIPAFAAYLYYSWLYKYNAKVMFGYENGTSGIKNFRIKDFLSIEPVIIPPVDVLGKFQQFVDSLQLQIQTRGSESSRLASLRDTLLPRLMSGELKVKEITQKYV